MREGEVEEGVGEGHEGVEEQRVLREMRAPTLEPLRRPSAQLIHLVLRRPLDEGEAGDLREEPHSFREQRAHHELKSLLDSDSHSRRSADRGCSCR